MQTNLDRNQLHDKHSEKHSNVRMKKQSNTSEDQFKKRTLKVFLQVVPVLCTQYMVTQYTVLCLQFVGSTINNTRRFTAGRAAREPTPP